jgi:hypothetical protein
VEFVIDTAALQVVEIGVITTERPITVTLVGSGGPRSRTQQPNITERYDVSVDLVQVTDGGVRDFIWPFLVQF